MFDTAEEVSKNKYVNNLVNEASSFNMYGAYVKYSKAKKPQNNGIYFICGYDKDKILDKNLDIEKLYEEQCNSKAMTINLNIAKITNQSPFAIHQQVMNYCLHASTFRAICNMCGYKNDFTAISTNFVLTLEKFYLSSVDTNLSLTERERYKIAMKNYLEEVGAEQKVTKGYNLDGPEVHLRPEKLDKKHPNMVSLEELHFKTLGTEQMVVSIEKFKKIKKELDKHPEILYFQAKPVVTRSSLFKHLNGEEISDSITIIFDAFYKKEMDIISLKAENPNCFRYSVQDLKEKYGDVCSLGVSVYDIDVIFSRATKMNIPLCLDEEKLYFTFDKNYSPNENIAGYTVTLPKKFMYEMDAILKSEANRLRDARVLTKQDEKEYSYQPSKPIVIQDDFDR